MPGNNDFIARARYCCARTWRGRATANKCSCSQGEKRLGPMKFKQVEWDIKVTHHVICGLYHTRVKFNYHSICNHRGWVGHIAMPRPRHSNTFSRIERVHPQSSTCPGNL